MDKNKILADKQIEFILKSSSKINLAHGSVRSGKTVCTLYRFMQSVYECEAQDHWMIGHTATTIKKNAVNLILYPQPVGFPDPLGMYRPFCTWLESKGQLLFGDKIINTCGVKDKGAIGLIQGATFSTCYGDEMTLWDESIIDMAKTRLSRPYSKLFGTMNPTHPSHKLKQWIDWATEGDKTYYALHFNIEDNPFIDEKYKNDLKKSLSGVFFRRNYLGHWCLAEGAIFDFFDRNAHVKRRPPTAAEYFIAGIDYGTNNAFACVIIGINTGRYTKTDPVMWVEKEYFWDSKKTGRQKTSDEFALDMQNLLEPYGIRAIYMDPSALEFRLQLQRRRMHVVPANNDVNNGIIALTSRIKSGELYILEECKNLIRELESYVWDPKRSEKGYDEPLKKDDHAIDALRYAVASHKISSFNEDEYYQRQNQLMKQRSPFP